MTWWMSQGYIKEATYQFSHLYLPGKCSISCVSRASSWSLRGHWRFLTGVLVVFDMVDTPRIHQGSYVSIFRFLLAWEVLYLPCVSRASLWSLRGRWRFLRGVLVVFDMVDDPRILQGSCMYIFIALPSWKVVHHFVRHADRRTDGRTDGRTDMLAFYIRLDEDE